MTAPVATRHPTCPVVTLVGTEGTNTVATSAKADGKRTPSAVLTPKRLFGTQARGSKHQLQQVDSDETTYDDFFSSPLRYYQLTVLDVSLARRDSHPQGLGSQVFLKGTI